MNDRTIKIWVRVVIPCALAAGLIGSIAWGGAQHAKAVDYEQHLDGLYDKSFQDLSDNLALLETSLEKIQVVSTPYQYTILLSENHRIASESAGLLAQVPASYINFASLNKFLVQLGDFSKQLLNQVAQGAPISTDDREQLMQLYNASVDINAQLQELRSNGEAVFSIQALDADGGYFSETEDAAYSFQNEEGQERYPTLIYDGPFADSTAQMEPKGLPQQSFDAEAAAIAARNFLADELAGDVTHTEDEDGRIPAYGFEATLQDERVAEMTVTKQGGKVLWMRHRDDMENVAAGSNPTSQRGTELAQIGREYLAQKGFSSMEPTYAQYYDGTALINYVFVQNSVMVYNDLIKVWIETESGRVVGVDTRDYLFSHVSRSVPAAELTPEDAQALLSPDLQVAQVKRALIPITANDERYCYEFKCYFNDDAFIIYINAVTGAEEEVFKIIDSESGQLVL